MDRLRPKHYTGDLHVQDLSLKQVVRNAIKRACRILEEHPAFTDCAEKFDQWEKAGVTALEPHGEALVSGDDFELGDDGANVEAEPPAAMDSECYSVEGYLNGGRVQYNGKEAHVMTIVNEKFNKQRARRSSARLMRIVGASAAPHTPQDYAVTPLGETIWVGAPFIAVVNFKEGKRNNSLKSTAYIFAFLEARLQHTPLPEPTHSALNCEYGCVVGIPMHFRPDEEGVLQFVSNAPNVQLSFNYTDVYFINPDLGLDGRWSISKDAVSTIAHGLYTRKVCAPLASLVPYKGIDAFRAVSDLKQGLHQCPYCSMEVNLQNHVQHMAFHIGRGEAVGDHLPCMFCGLTDGLCHLDMSKVQTCKARWQMRSGSCAHHRYRKVSSLPLHPSPSLPPPVPP